MIKISASQCATYRKCHRKYSYEYVDGKRSPSTPKQEFGTNMHTELEEWMLYGKVPGMVAQQGIKYLPDRSFVNRPDLPTILVEQQIDEELLGFFITGRMDIMLLASARASIYDHKTTSNMKYALDSEGLSNDTSALFYALYVRLKYNISEIDLRWIYYSATNPVIGNRKPNGCREVIAELRDNAETDEKFHNLVVDMTRMIHIRENSIKPEFCERNFASCETYGGCFHKSYCITDEVRAGLLKEKLRKSL